MTVPIKDNMNDGNNHKDGKIFVRVDLETVRQLLILAHPNEISPDLITKVIQHCYACDKWRAGKQA